MKLTKEKLVDGVATYINEEVIKNVPDTSVKVILGTAIFSMRSNPSLLEQYVFENPIFCAVCKSENGYYTIDTIIQSLRQSMETYGNLTFTIPAIPLISKEAKVLSFSVNDVNELQRYLERSVG